MFVAVTAMCARMAGRNDLVDVMSVLPEAGQRLMRDFEPAAREIGENLSFDRFYFLGSGIRYGLACEVNLKMKEMTLTHSEPFHFLEFRHGPMSMVNENAVVIGMVSECKLSHEKAVFKRDAGARGKDRDVSRIRCRYFIHESNSRTGARRFISACSAIDGVLSLAGKGIESRQAHQSNCCCEIKYLRRYNRKSF